VDERPAGSGAAPGAGHAQGAVAPGGTLLVVGHDTTNLIHGCGGPQDPSVLVTSEEVANDLDELRIVRADHVRRRVDSEQGPKRQGDDEPLGAVAMGRIGPHQAWSRPEAP